MDKVFEHFGIYDFMGVWGPGALTVTYYIFTWKNLLQAIYSMLNLKTLYLSQTDLLIILYTAIAYFIGVILHETAKILFDFFPQFKMENANNPDALISNFAMNFSVFVNIKDDYKRSLLTIIPENDLQLLNFEKCILILKYSSEDRKRIDKYHSIYALARSLFLCFGFHGLLSLLYIIIIYNSISTDICILRLELTLDILLCILFYIRSFRYFGSWTKNVIIQYYLYCKENGRLV